MKYRCEIVHILRRLYPKRRHRQARGQYGRILITLVDWLTLSGLDLYSESAVRRPTVTKFDSVQRQIVVCCYCSTNPAQCTPMYWLWPSTEVTWKWVSTSAKRDLGTSGCWCQGSTFQTETGTPSLSQGKRTVTIATRHVTCGNGNSNRRRSRNADELSVVVVREHNISGELQRLHYFNTKSNPDPNHNRNLS